MIALMRAISDMRKRIHSCLYLLDIIIAGCRLFKRLIILSTVICIRFSSIENSDAACVRLYFRSAARKVQRRVFLRTSLTYIISSFIS